MALQNRVAPTGEIVVEPERGTMLGNRGGCFHDEDRKLSGRRRWANNHWLVCVLDFKGRRREVMAPRRYTELFFLDEPTALAAGHRPCAECRRPDFDHFAALWHNHLSEPADVAGSVATARQGRRAKVAEMDRVLHAERWAARGGFRPHPGTPRVPVGSLPVGAMVWLNRVVCVPNSDASSDLSREIWAVVRHSEGECELALWSFAGYGARNVLPSETPVVALTPPSTCRILAAGYPVVWHPTMSSGAS